MGRRRFHTTTVPTVVHDKDYPGVRPVSCVLNELDSRIDEVLVEMRQRVRALEDRGARDGECREPCDGDSDVCRLVRRPACKGPVEVAEWLELQARHSEGLAEADHTLHGGAAATLRGRARILADAAALIRGAYGDG